MSRVKALSFAVVISLLFAIVHPPVGFCQTGSSPITVGFKSGHVNEVRSTSIEIDERSYELKSDVIILDHKGNPLALDRIVPTSLVKFHLKEGHVDKMVVTLPQ